MLLFLSFPKFGHGAVAWLALVPLLLALHGASGWRALRLGYVAGAVSSLGLLYWTALVVVQYGGMPLAGRRARDGRAVPRVLGLPRAVRLGVGRLTTPSARRACSAPRSRGWRSSGARSVTFFQFPWCLLGYSQQQNLPVHPDRLA